jgi:integrase
MGLGPARGDGAVPLAAARLHAAQAREALRAGADPLERRAAAAAEAKAAALAAAARGMTFRAVAMAYIEANAAAWRSAVHRRQWTNSLRDHAHPLLGDLPVADIGAAEVMAALEPLWRRAPETASRLRGRIEVVLDYARARGWRSGENPARWRGHVAHLLPPRRRLAPVRHHPSVAWQRAGALAAELRAREGIAARAVEFALLTAARSGEVRGARWSEVDLDAGVWTLPPARMKSGKEHRAALCGPALALLRGLLPLRRSADGLVFPGRSGARPLDDTALSRALRRCPTGAGATVHGLRATFRSWCAEATNYPREVAEMALAHVVGDAVERAYQRGDVFEKRRRLMEAWGQHCAQPAQTGRVVALARRA